MNLFEFLISTSFIVSITFLMSCVWKRFKEFKPNSKPNKSYNNITEYVENNTTEKSVLNGEHKDSDQAIDDQANESTTNSELGEFNISHKNETPLEYSSKENLTPVPAPDPVVVRFERLEHINKSRPKRSNIRRSTRKSKFNSTLIEENFCQNNTNLEPNEESKTSDFKNDLEEQISQRLSMFSLRIEEVTQPLSPNPHKTQSFDDQHKNENLQQIIQMESNSTENTNIYDISVNKITKLNARPIFNPEIIAEIKSKQGQLNIRHSID